ECVVVGHPRPTVEWYKDEIKLDISERFITEYHQDGRCTLTIQNITVDEEAKYLCQAQNDAGVAKSWIEIFVES
ncbi:hypothetical protein LOTGIDRAFT_60433, partial [Lottia gigantea]